MITNKTASSLIPMADSYLENNMNLLLIGLHGTGKTQSILDLAERHGIKIKYYSCATLDPYTDLVGVPVPKIDENGREVLKMIRPREVDEAELIFFDEFNRADSKTTNAVFEIIQFGSINGEKLPNLRCCWAAINPPDKSYDVEELDPALMDRFDAFIEIKPKPSINYMVERGISKSVAVALKTWWDSHNRVKRDFADYISPRRLEKIGLVYEKMGNIKAVQNALPPGGNFDTKKLINLLEIATGKRIGEIETNNIGGMPSSKFKYAVGSLYKDKGAVIKHLKENPLELETHKAVVDALRTSNVSHETIIKSFSDMLESVTPSILEGYIAGLSPAKRSQVRSAFQAAKSQNKNFSSPNLAKILSKGARSGDWT